MQLMVLCQTIYLTDTGLVTGLSDPNVVILFFVNNVLLSIHNAHVKYFEYRPILKMSHRHPIRKCWPTMIHIK